MKFLGVYSYFLNLFFIFWLISFAVFLNYLPNHLSGLPALGIKYQPKIFNYRTFRLPLLINLYIILYAVLEVLFHFSESFFIFLLSSEYFLLLYFYIFIILYYMLKVHPLCILFKLFLIF